MSQNLDWNEIEELRRQLHQAPELSEKEVETASRMADWLKQCEPNHLLTHLGPMGTGLCAVFEGAAAGPTVALRCELDALPIHEGDSLPHHSLNPGVSHKCGHDGHMATLGAVARLLQKAPPARGRVALVFQPAEETGTGAQGILNDPKFTSLVQPDWIFGFHNVPKFPLGSILVRKGTFAAASVGFILELKGRTSHSSYPENGLSPTETVSHLLRELEALPQTHAKEFQDRVASTISFARVGSAELGPNFGTAPGAATVMGVLRAYRTEDLQRLKHVLELVAKQSAAPRGLELTLSWHEQFPATVNHAGAVDHVVKVAGKLGMAVEVLSEPFRWSEDFAYFTQEIPGAFFGLGSGKDQPQLHDETYDYPDSLLPKGARMYFALVQELCAP